LTWNSAAAVSALVCIVTRLSRSMMTGAVISKWAAASWFDTREFCMRAAAALRASMLPVSPSATVMVTEPFGRFSAFASSIAARMVHVPAAVSQTPLPTLTPAADAEPSSESTKKVWVAAWALAATTSEPPTTAAAVVMAAARRRHLCGAEPRERDVASAFLSRRFMADPPGSRVAPGIQPRRQGRAHTREEAGFSGQTTEVPRRDA